MNTFILALSSHLRPCVPMQTADILAMVAWMVLQAVVRVACIEYQSKASLSPAEKVVSPTLTLQPIDTVATD
jgi:hypothetical protein